MRESSDFIADFESQIEHPPLDHTPISKLISDSISRYQTLTKPKGLPTGFLRFDSDSGGLHKGNLIVVAAETGTGKTAFCLNLINNNCLHEDSHIALFSLEMDSTEIIDLLFSINAGIDRNHFNTGAFTDPERKSMATWAPRISRFPLTIFDDSSPTVDQIKASCLDLPPLSLIVVDYLQLVSPTNPRDLREQQISGISRQLKALAKLCKCPLIAVSQLNEEGKIRESRAVAHDAHVVFILSNNGTFFANVTKGRGIPKHSYPLLFNPTLARLGNP